MFCFAAPEDTLSASASQSSPQKAKLLFPGKVLTLSLCRQTFLQGNIRVIPNLVALCTDPQGFLAKVYRIPFCSMGKLTISGEAWPCKTLLRLYLSFPTGSWRPRGSIQHTHVFHVAINESELFLRVNFAYSVSLSMKKSIICHFYFAKFKYTQTCRSTCLQNDTT